MFHAQVSSAECSVTVLGCISAASVILINKRAWREGERRWREGFGPAKNFGMASPMMCKCTVPVSFKVFQSFVVIVTVVSVCLSVCVTEVECWRDSEELVRCYKSQVVDRRRSSELSVGVWEHSASVAVCYRQHGWRWCSYCVPIIPHLLYIVSK